VSALKHDACNLEFANMKPNLLELLRITHLTDMFLA
jgi:hypothetical protein